jgi:hypothetical protein
MAAVLRFGTRLRAIIGRASGAIRRLFETKSPITEAPPDARSLRPSQSRAILIDMSDVASRCLSTQPYGKVPISTWALAAAVAILALACDAGYQPTPADGASGCDPPLPATCNASGQSSILPVVAARCPALAASSCYYPADDKHTIYLTCVNEPDTGDGAYGFVFCTAPGCGDACLQSTSDAASPVDVSMREATTTD